MYEEATNKCERGEPIIYSVNYIENKQQITKHKERRKNKSYNESVMGKVWTKDAEQFSRESDIEKHKKCR